MQRARMLGNYVQQLAEQNDLSIGELGSILGCQEHQIKSFLKGRSFATFAQMSLLAKKLDVSIDDLLQGNEEHYNATVVHCMNQFHDNANREKILDLIDDYMDIIDAVEAQVNN